MPAFNTLAYAHANDTMFNVAVAKYYNIVKLLRQYSDQCNRAIIFTRLLCNHILGARLSLAAFRRLVHEQI